jgi:circadian clock protein KaiC
VLKRIVQEVAATSPAVVVVDSFRSVIQVTRDRQGPDLQRFIQDLGMQMTSWQATTFLVGEFQLADADTHPVFTVADGLMWLYQSVDRNSMVRKMNVMKMRGQASIPGLHTFRISERGIHVFPRLIFGASELPAASGTGKARYRPQLSVGVPRLDEMLGGGIPSGYSVLVAGPSGSGKSVLALQFIRDGIRRGEPGVFAIFEKHAGESAHTCDTELDQAVRSGQVAVVQPRPLDLSIDEMLYELTETIHRIKATRIVIDSLSGFELALAPTFREDFRESLYRLVSALTGKGLTVMMTAELEDRYSDFRFSPHGTAFLTDAIILQRYLEIEGQLKRIMAVVKMRASDHSKDLRSFEITDDGLVVGERIGDYEGLLTGSPHLAPPASSLSPHRRALRRPKS